jgi:hypothetical protein
MLNEKKMTKQAYHPEEWLLKKPNIPSFSPNRRPLLHFLRLRRMSEPNQFDICDEYPNG